MTAVCFDLDGTLTDPKLGITRSIQYAMAEIGNPVPDAAELTWCIGPPLLQSFEKLIGDARLARSALTAYRERFSDVGLYENEIYAGIRDVLEALDAAGRRLFVATSKPTVYAERIVEHFELSSQFEAVCGSELDGTRSDKTDLIAWMVQEYRLEPASSIMIGDRSHDIIGALNNGVAGLGVLYGYGTRTELVDAGAAQLFERPGDIAEIIK